MKAFFKYIIRYKYLLTILLFVVWMLFFDQNRMLNQLKMRRTLRDLENQKQYYIEEIENNQQLIQDLTEDTAFMERYAREHYLLKKDNEEIYLIVEQE